MIYDSCNAPMHKMHIRLFLSDTNFRSPRLSKVYMTFDHITFVYTTFESIYDFRSITFVHMTNESIGRLSFYNFWSPRLSKVYLDFLSITNENLYRLTKVIELTKIHLDFRKSYSAKLLAKTPPVEIMNPLQWKLRVDPRSGNMVLIR